ncbi:MAG: 3-dehydroquinate synthase [Planctomycetota bacterium]
MSSTVRVALGPRSYDIVLGSNLLASVGELIVQLTSASHVFLISDNHLLESHAQTVVESLQASGLRCDRGVIPAGESFKTVSECERMWRELLAVRADRKTVVVAVGGGVIGDMAGFIAASYARGLRFYQIPTTLLSQVDSSVGGKVGVNLPHSKNMVGAFWQPVGVLIDIQTLTTLPDREYRSGLAEVVKYGVILDAPFFGELEQQIAALNDRHPDVLQHVVARCCRLKADVVEKDEREETGLRAVLNYGHTFCHALETVTGYGRWLHGEAVSIGMVCAARLARLLGRIDADLEQRQQQLLAALRLPTTLPPGLDHDQLIAAMALDKKVEHGRLRFVLPSELGQVELVGNVDVQLVRQAMAECQA